jgi:hypothetical protein
MAMVFLAQHGFLAQQREWQWLFWHHKESGHGFLAQPKESGNGFFGTTKRVAMAS